MKYVVIVNNKYCGLEVETIDFNQFGMTSYSIRFEIKVERYVKFGKDRFDLVEVVGKTDNLEELESLFLKGLERVNEIKREMA